MLITIESIFKTYSSVKQNFKVLVISLMKYCYVREENACVKLWTVISLDVKIYCLDSIDMDDVGDIWFAI